MKIRLIILGFFVFSGCANRWNLCEDLSPDQCEKVVFVMNPVFDPYAIDKEKANKARCEAQGKTSAGDGCNCCVYDGEKIGTCTLAYCIPGPQL